MKKTTLTGLLALAVASISATALASQDTDYFTIGRLEAAPNSSDGYRIYPAAGYALPTSQNCAKSDFAEVQSGIFAANRNSIHRTALAAFLAGRQVKLRLDGCGVQGRPAYRIISLSSTK